MAKRRIRGASSPAWAKPFRGGNRHDPRSLDRPKAPKRRRTELDDEASRELTPPEDKDFMDEARARFEMVSTSEKEQRERELADLRFFAGDQWPDDVKAARAGQNASNGLPPVPARPCLTINKVREPVNQVLNQERQADMSITIAAADDFGDAVGELSKEEITTREGLVRRIQRDQSASDARSWAFQRAVQAGRGFYGVMTRYLPGKTFDQELYVHRWFNQACVSIDPLHEMPDGSDAEWGFVGNDMYWDSYVASHPQDAKGRQNPVLAADDDTFRAFGEDYPGWFTTEDEVRIVRVVDYYYTVSTTRELVELKDGTIEFLDALDPKPADGDIVQRRNVVEKQIKWAKIDGVQKLEETDWQGPDIPIVKVLGVELQPYDKERRCEGMVRPARDSQQGFNSMVSKWVESVALSPIPPFQVTPDQVKGYERWYEAANTRTLPYLPYNMISEAGELLSAPTRTPVDTPVTAIAGSIQVFNEAIQSTTGVPDPQLGKSDPSLRSAKAIQALQSQSQVGTSNFLDNLRRSIRYEGQIINNLLYPIYGTKPGRLVKILTGEGTIETLAVGAGPAGQQPPARPLPPNIKLFALTKDAKFNVVVKVTRAYDSRRDEEVNELGDLIGKRPELMTWFGDLYFKNQDGPGHDEMAERAKVMLAPPIQQLLAQKEQSQGNVPASVSSVIAQLEQRLQRAEQIMQGAEQELKSKQLEQQTKLEQTRIDGITSLHLQQMKDATAIRVAELNALTKGVVSADAAQVQAIALAHEADQNRIQRSHEQELAAVQQQNENARTVAGQAHEAAMGDQAHQQALEQGAAGHAQAMEQQQQAADLAPEPDEGASE